MFKPESSESTLNKKKSQLGSALKIESTFVKESTFNIPEYQKSTLQPQKLTV